ncbi:MAG: T9SS type A sorting domain-containing protein [Bacteroidota bacterium]
MFNNYLRIIALLLFPGFLFAQTPVFNGVIVNNCPNTASFCSGNAASVEFLITNLPNGTQFVDVITDNNSQNDFFNINSQNAVRFDDCVREIELIEALTIQGGLIAETGPFQQPPFLITGIPTGVVSLSSAPGNGSTGVLRISSTRAVDPSDWDFVVYDQNFNVVEDEEGDLEWSVFGVGYARNAAGILLPEYQISLFGSNFSGCTESFFVLFRANSAFCNDTRFAGFQINLIGNGNCLASSATTLRLKDAVAAYESGSTSRVAAVKSDAATTERLAIQAEEPSIFPNPTNETTLYIDNATAIQSVHLVNLNGQMVRTINYRQDNPGRLAFDVSEIPNGTYFIEIYTEEGERSIQKVQLLR